MGRLDYSGNFVCRAGCNQRHVILFDQMGGLQNQKRRHCAAICAMILHELETDISSDCGDR